MSKSTETMEKIVALCRRRGFIFGSSEIYGGIGGFWDYGPLGCELKRNIKDAWWNDMVRNPPVGPGGREFQMVGVDCSIIMNPKVWEASGHVGGFSDPMISCKREGCKRLFRADKLFQRGFYDSGDDRYRDDVYREMVAARDRGDMQTASRLAQDLRDPPSILFTVEADSVEDAIARFPFEILSNTQRKKLKGEPRDAIRPLNIGDTWGWPAPRCPHCDGELTEARAFNLMNKTNIGALEDASSVAYLRPETAQGIFVNFKNVMDTTRVKIPFGIAQIGKAFRNEINPRNYTFRSREFEQMEIEFFCNPKESMTWYEFWRDVRIGWYESLGIKSDKLRPRQQGPEELAHYSDACTDIEYLFPFSGEPQELEGVAHRGSFDLTQHGKFSKGKEDAFAVLDDSEPRSSDRAEAPASSDARTAQTPRGLKSAARFVPHVIEPSAGVDRFTLAAICEAYSFDESRASPEFMKFHPRLAPIKAAVFPLVAKDGLPEIAEPIYDGIRREFPSQYDAKQSIGKRYARMDEAGTPFCFTIDSETKENGTVTVRNRDDASQVRIDKSRCLAYLRDRLKL